MGKRADQRMVVNRSWASQPDRVRWVLEMLEAGPHFRLREAEDLFPERDPPRPAPSIVSSEQEALSLSA
jgi:hypothetical protein